MSVILPDCKLPYSPSTWWCPGHTGHIGDSFTVLHHDRTTLLLYRVMLCTETDSCYLSYRIDHCIHLHALSSHGCFGGPAAFGGRRGGIVITRPQREPWSIILHYSAFPLRSFLSSFLPSFLPLPLFSLFFLLSSFLLCCALFASFLAACFFSLPFLPFLYLLSSHFHFARFHPLLPTGSLPASLFPPSPS